VLRFCAILFTALAGLIPIVATTISGGDRDRQMLINQFGYVSIGLAAACIAFDKFYGNSTGWMRYMHTNLIIEGSIERLRLGWSRAKAEQQEGKVDVPKCLQLLCTFMEEMHTAVKKETEDWIAEFQTNIQEMQRETAQAWSAVRDQVHKEAEETRRLAEEARRAEAEVEKRVEEARKAATGASRFGAIEVSIKKGAENAPEGVDVALDGVIYAEHVTGPTCGIARVPPGIHDVAVTSVSDGHRRCASCVAIVKPNEAVKVDIALE
jgi:hypothetical protein